MERKQLCESIEDNSQVNSCCEAAVESQLAQAPRKAARKRHRGKNRKMHLKDVYAKKNMKKAYKDARKGKGDKYGVRKFDSHWNENMKTLRLSLRDETFETEKPKMVEKMCEHKVRVLSKVKFKNNVAYHSLMNVISPAIDKSYYYESAASIRGRGIHYLVKHTKRWIEKNNHKPIYFAQLDFVKCYHNIRRDLVYDKFCHYFNDKGIQRLCHDFIYALRDHNGLVPSDGTRGMGIGLFPVQPAVNFTYNDMDRKVARAVKGGFYARYCDNMVIMAHSAADVWKGINVILYEAENTYDQPLHTNIGVQKMDEDRQGLDFIGYVFYLHKTYIRKSIKVRFKRKFNKVTDPVARQAMLASYAGWLLHANGNHLWQKVTGMIQFSELNIKKSDTTKDGKRFFNVPSVSASFLVGRKIVVKDFVEGVETSHGSDRVAVLISENGVDRKFITNNAMLKDILAQVRAMNQFPFEATMKSRSLDGGKIDYYFE